MRTRLDPSRSPARAFAICIAAVVLAAGCQKERKEVGFGPGETSATGSGGGGGGGSDATSTAAGGTGAGGETAIGSACASLCAQSSRLACHPANCEAECVALAAGCEAEFAALFACVSTDAANFSCSGGQVQANPQACPDELAAATACN